ncbi:MAG: SLAC1 family transporter [Chloroflexota bacterium]
MLLKKSSAPPVSGRLPVSRLRDLHPGWFGAIMGTAVVGLAASLNPGLHPAWRGVSSGGAAVFLGLAYLGALVLAPAYLLRLARYPELARRDLHHPLFGALYATVPGGLLVLAAATAVIGPALLGQTLTTALVALLGVSGALLAVLVSVTFAYVQFTADGVPLDNANGGWFIPPVVVVIVPLALLPLVPWVAPEWGRLLGVLSCAAWGAGFMSFLLTLALIYSRLILRPLPAQPLAPTIWIALGPIGVSGLGLLRLGEAGAVLWGEASATVSVLAAGAALALWGFGLWWLVMTSLLLLRYVGAGGLRYSVGWWAFTFPLGAFTVDTILLARTWRVEPLEWLAVFLFLALLVFWLQVARRTALAVRSGEAWLR